MWTKNKIDLLKAIVKNKSLTIEDLQKNFQLKERQIYVLLREINYFLESNHIPMIKFGKNGSNFPLKWEKLKRILTKDFYLFSQDERINFICFDILINQDLKTIDYYAEFFKVSKNTILLDLKKVRGGLLRKYNLSLLIENSNLNILGDEISKRHFLIHYTSSFLINYEDFIIKKLLNFFAVNDKKIKKFLDDFYKITKITNSENYNQFLFLYLSILKIYYQKFSFLKMSKKDKNIISKFRYFNEIDALCTYVLGDKISENNEDEKFYITILMSSGNLQSDFELVSKNLFYDIDLTDSISKMLLNIEKTTFLFFYDRSELVKNIEAHLVYSYYRIKYLPINFSYINAIKDKYEIVYEITKKNISYIEKCLKTKFLEDEIALITLYLVNNLYADSENFNKVKAIILHDGKINIFKNEIENVLNIDVVYEGSINEFKKINEPFDLILTSKNFNEITNKKVFKIDRILTEDNRREIEFLIDEIIQQKTNKSNHLLDVLKPECIKIYQQKISNWKDIIKVSSQSLIDNDYIDNKYVDAMIEVVKKYDAIVNLQNNIVMLHASYKDGVKKLGISINVFKNKVKFPKCDDLDIVIVLSPIDRESHIKLMFQLLDFVKKKTNVSQLLSKQNSQEIFDFIVSKFNV